MMAAYPARVVRQGLERWRRVPLLVSAALLMAFVPTACGGGSDRADGGKTQRLAPGAATHYAQWRRRIITAVRADPLTRFANLPRRVFLARLDELSRAHKFHVESVRFFRPKQDAPVVVIRTRDKHALSKATPAILRRINPKAPTGDDRTGWAYEALFFEAREGDGSPFLVVFNNWRGPSAGGGQWVLDPRLFPFPHGGPPTD